MFPFGVTLSRSEGSPSFGKEAAITNKKKGAQALSPAPPLYIYNVATPLLM
jgi:hypothetical protein